jgi:copper(I)-binding protein
MRITMLPVRRTALGLRARTPRACAAARARRDARGARRRRRPVISDAWVRQVPPAARMTAGYLRSTTRARSRS